MNGIWGTFAVGLFATNTAPGYAIADKNGNELVGLFYGGGVKLLGLQCLWYHYRSGMGSSYNYNYIPCY